MNFLPNALRISAFIDSPHFSSAALKELCQMDLGTVIWNPLHFSERERMAFSKVFEGCQSKVRLVVCHDVLLAHKMNAQGVLLGPNPSPKELLRAQEVMGTQKWIGGIWKDPIHHPVECELIADFYIFQGSCTSPLELKFSNKNIVFIEEIAADVENLELYSGVCFCLKAGDSLVHFSQCIEALNEKLARSGRSAAKNLSTDDFGFQFSNLNHSTLQMNKTPLQTPILK
jgi:hypothetical protein